MEKVLEFDDTLVSDLLMDFDLFHYVFFRSALKVCLVDTLRCVLYLCCQVCQLVHLPRRTFTQQTSSSVLDSDRSSTFVGGVFFDDHFFFVLSWRGRHYL